MSSTHSLLRAQGHASFVSHPAEQSLSSSSSSLFPAVGSTSSSASRLLADSTACGINGSGFEDNDGNLAVDHTADGCTDWNSFAPVTWTGTAPYQTATASSGAFNFVGISDATGGSDTSYKDGTKQADTCPAVDQAGSTPNKDDLARIYIAGERINNHPYLFLAWVRAPQNTINSDLHVAFEFNQSQVACSNGDGLVNRTKGDLLVGYEFQSATPTITLATWTGTTWSAATTLPPTVAEAAVNTTAGVTDSVKPSGAPDPAQDEFGEAGIDIGALITAGGGKACETFGTVSGASRTSGSSTSSNMEDLVGPAPIDISNCATPTIATQTSVSSMNIGDTQTVGDTATLTDGNSPTGNVSFQLYSDAACTVPVAGVSGSAAIVNGVATFAGASFTPTAAGTYYWGVSYPGDDFNNAVSSCGGANEEIVVNPASPSVTTVAAPSSAVIGANSLTTVSDTATFTNGFMLDGQSASFTLYSNTACTNATNVTGSATINGGSATFTGDASSLAPGTYYWGVNYAGDTNNNPISECGGAEGVQNEVLTITKASPNVTTVAAPSSTVVGSDASASVSDTATFTNGFMLDGQSASFTLYSNTACTNATNVTGSATINGGSATFTGDASSLAPGTYYWGVNYAGDTNNNSVSECGGAEDVNNEVLTITKASPAVTTMATPSSTVVGSDASKSVSDTATFTNGFMLDGQSATFTLYSDTACTNATSVTGSATINGGSATFTGDASSLAPGTYYWGVNYAGDTNNNPISECGGAEGVQNEVLTITKASPNVTTVADPNSVVDGSDASASVSDTATFTNGFMLDGQSASFTLYSDTACTNATSVTGSAQISGGTATFTGDASSLAPGTYYWGVNYAGDTNNNPISECGGAEGVQNEVLQIGANAPKVTTVADPSSVTVGSDASASVSDTATFTDGFMLDGQSASFTLYSDTACTNATSVTGSATISGNAATFTGDASSLAPGTYYWGVNYAGDANNNSVSECGGDDGVTNEVLTITKQPTSIGTAATSGSNGDAIHDVATLSGGVNVPQGTITFNLYGPSDTPNCSGDPVYTNTVEVDGNGDYNSGDFTPTTAGSYYWVASYSGDANNLSSTGLCGDEGETSTIKAASIQIVKTADAAAVNVGGQIGFTMTVWNSGDGDAHGVKLNDTLPTAPGVSWSIDKQGAGWAGSCAIAAGVLTCGGSNGVTVPGDTTQAASTFTVHIVSGTTGATGGDCPTTGVINNTGSVTTSNDGSGQSNASTCVQAMVDLSITKTGSPDNQDLGQGNITWTMVVTNNGPSADTGVTVTDPMPTGNTFVSATSSQGSCAGGPILTCTIGNMAAGATVTITLVTTPTQAGAQTNTASVSGNRPETNTTNNQATATVQVGKVTPPVFCVAVSQVTPKQLFVGRKTMLTIHLTKNKKAVSGVHVRIKGPKLNIKTKASNARGVVKQTVKMKKAGVLIFTPIASKSCNTKRVGVTNVFTPPVTG